MQEKKSLKNLKIKKLTIVGVIPSFAFQRAKHCALELHRKLPQRFPLPEIVGLLELDWSEKLQEWRQSFGREYWCLRRPVAVFFDEKFIGSDIELIKLMTLGNILLENIPRKNMSFLKEQFRNEYLSYLRKTKRIYCYLDICINEVYAGTLTFQLYSDLLPRTCENFKTLCLGSRGPLLSYRGTRIHRIVKKGWLQGGDVQYKTGGGGFSIFCDPLEDESFAISHDRRGVLSMASAGRHENGSQFFITLQPSKWMDTHFVAFGQLIEGGKVLQTLENLETLYERPLKKVEIKSCGKLDLEDVEDVDAAYREEPMPSKKQQKMETICEQIVRLTMEALTEALARKEHIPDILDGGDIPSKMNLQLYFQGFYSLPESILEESAAYIRSLRRRLLRVIKPNATEIVEVIMYDLMMAVLTRMTTLDDVRETIGHKLYEKMLTGIDMNLEMRRKDYVKGLINQIATTAEKMVSHVAKKVAMMKSASSNFKKFQDTMQNWVQSFVLQETFAGDNYFIADRGVIPKKPKIEVKYYPYRQGKPCCEAEKKKKEKELHEKLLAKYGPRAFCCLGSKVHLSDSVINVNEFFCKCRYNLKRTPKEEEERMPLLDLIEISRFKLRFVRKQQDRVRDQTRLCIDKKIRKWMAEIIYIPETSWLKDAVFPKDCLVIDHMEEILYGAMTAGLLEMYYFMEEYLKLCGLNDKSDTAVTQSEDLDLGPAEEKYQKPVPEKLQQVKREEEEEEEEEVRTENGSGRGAGEEGEYEVEEEKKEEKVDQEEMVEEEQIQKEEKEEKKEEKEEKRRSCTCGHPCCKCPSDRHLKQTVEEEREVSEDKHEKEKKELKKEKIEEEEEEEEEEGEEEEEEEREENKREKNKREEEENEEKSFTETSLEKGKGPCASDEILVFTTALANKLTMKPEEIDIKSFKWLTPYILEKGCNLKSEFARRTHKWLEGETFTFKDILSKHSIASRASLLSLSFSLAELIKEENNYKADIKNFIYDLWNLYFEEVFNEAFLEHPPEEGTAEEQKIKSEGDESSDQQSDLQKRDRKEKGETKEEKKAREKMEKDQASVCDTDLSELEKICQKFKEEEEKRALEEKKSKIPRKINKDNESVQTPSKASKESSKTEEKFPKSPRPTSQGNQIVEGRANDGKNNAEPQIGDSNRKENVIEGTIGESKEKKTERNDMAGDTKVEVKLLKKISVKMEADDGGATGKTKGEVKHVKKKVDHDGSITEKSSTKIDYVLPFWVKFLTELTKQALGALAKVSRLPRRLYFQSDSEMAFDDKMKEWFEFNAFNPQPTKGREVMDYIALHHKNLTNLEDTARSFLKKKKYSELINRCTRDSTADDIADEILSNVIDSAQEQSQNEILNLFVSSLLSVAVSSGPLHPSISKEGEESEDFRTFETESREFNSENGSDTQSVVEENI